MENIKKQLDSIIIFAALFISACQPVVQNTQLPVAVTQKPAETSKQIPIPTSQVIQTNTPEPAPISSITPTARPAVNRVLIISIDGLRPDAIALAPMPNLLKLMQDGAYTLSGQTIFPSSTLPSHTSMLTGLCPAKHGVDWNDYLPEKGYAKGIGLFNLAHAAGLKTVMFVGKEKLVQITEPQNVDIFRYINDRDVVIAEKIQQEFPADFGLMFVHFATPDAMGHAYGWMSPQYLSVIRRSDEALGSILSELEKHGLKQDTLVIVTADHGGHKQGHGSRAAEDMTIPWIVIGPGVKPGELNSQIQTTDTAATAAWILNLNRPQDWDGWPVFEAFNQPLQPRPFPFCQ